MPPLTATPKALEPVVLAPTVSIDEPDAWLEKVFGLQRSCKDSERLDASVSSDSDEEEHSYREELRKYITESTVNLNDEPLDEDSSDDESESPGSDVFDFDSDDEDNYVEPPVEVPRCYRTQDLQGGMIVGGDCVIFTNWAFKRLLQRRRRLPPVSERRNSADSEADEEEGVYSGKIVEL
ncbi:hypothetical protein DVH05_020801 [Phytophthora capsici]|nr:hypothetical protein DVH05_020801 [Phytophthora capsici]|eukprot:jgi/Phyca11/505511/fgenesh2_kg.PHYCAscaffold_13_\